MNKTRSTSDRVHAGNGSRRGYTLVELVFTMTLIVVLMALTLVTVGSMVKQARLAAERQFLGSLKMGVEQFKQSFGFYPPLVGLGANLQQQRLDSTGNHSSPYSLPYYLLGIGDRLLDGYDGPGQGRPKEDGTWDTGAPMTDALIDVSRDRERYSPFTRVFQDRWGGAIEYFRWEPSMHGKFLPGGALNPQFGEVASANIPPALYDDTEDRWADKFNSAAGLRAGAFAIVSAGPDGQLNRLARSADGNAALWDAQNKDNLAEVGR